MMEGEEGVGLVGDDCLFGGDGLLDEADNGVIDDSNNWWFDISDDCLSNGID